MSHECIFPPCARMLCDDDESLACTMHWARVSLTTRQRLAEATTDVGWDSARDQALIEMSRPLALLR